LAAQVIAALECHARVEETVFYPACAVEADEDGALLIGGALRDHQVVREGIAALRDIDDAAVCEAFFHQWLMYVEQHMEEEERVLFPKVQQHLTAEMDEITEEIQDLKARLLAAQRV
jgi:iron-sulfur cluster repair protein YtfE (RIC family)